MVTNTDAMKPEWQDLYGLHDDVAATGPLSIGDSLTKMSFTELAPRNMGERLERVKKARNPFLEAAQVLLRSLADMPQDLASETEVKALHAMLSMEIEAFTKLCEQANLRRDHMLVVRYALCTALDEAAGQTNWGAGKYQDASESSFIDIESFGETPGAQSSQVDSSDMGVGIWSTQSLLQKYHKEGYGGYKVFLLIGRLSADSSEHAHVLEVMLQLLHLGFEGDFHTKAEGKRTLESIRNKLFTQLTLPKDASLKELSPNWKGMSGKFKMLRSIPVWLTALILGLLVGSMFVWFKYRLVTDSQAIQKRIEALGKLQAAPAAAGTTKLRELLSVEIAQNLVVVQEDGGVTQVIFPGDKMFAPAKAEISESIAKVLARVAQELKIVSGDVTIVGHSDNTTSRSISNQELSELRAQAVATQLLNAGISADRITSLGKGDTEPIADNNTPQGRAKNRRVTLTISSAVSKDVKK